MIVSCVHKYEHRKLLLESIGSKSMDEVVSVITGYSQNLRCCASRKKLRLKHESAIKIFKEGEHD